MDKKELLKKVEIDLEIMMNGNEFDVRHLFGLSIWGSYPKNDQDLIAKMLFELSQVELKDQISISQSNQNLALQKYIKNGDKTVKKPTQVFPNEPVTINRGSRGNA